MKFFLMTFDYVMGTMMLGLQLAVSLLAVTAIQGLIRLKKSCPLLMKMRKYGGPALLPHLGTFQRQNAN